MADSDDAEPDFGPIIERADKETLWWALYRLMQAVQFARAEVKIRPATPAHTALHIVGYTADHWGPQVEGMPTLDAAAEEIHGDDFHHELTEMGERQRRYITGDEFM